MLLVSQLFFYFYTKEEPAKLRLNKSLLKSIQTNKKHCLSTVNVKDSLQITILTI